MRSRNSFQVHQNLSVDERIKESFSWKFEGKILNERMFEGAPKFSGNDRKNLSPMWEESEWQVKDRVNEGIVVVATC